MSEEKTPMRISRRVVANIRRLRRARGWSAQELANRMDAVGCPVSRSMISQRETGSQRIRVSVDELVAFADVLDQPLDDLVHEEVACEQCAGSPPAGFRCRTCGSEA